MTPQKTGSRWKVIVTPDLVNPLRMTRTPVPLPDGLRDGWETGGCRDLVVTDKLMPSDLKSFGTLCGRPRGLWKSSGAVYELVLAYYSVHPPILGHINQFQLVKTYVLLYICMYVTCSK